MCEAGVGVPLLERAAVAPQVPCWLAGLDVVHWVFHY